MIKQTAQVLNKTYCQRSGLELEGMMEQADMKKQVRV